MNVDAAKCRASKDTKCRPRFMWYSWGAPKSKFVSLKASENPLPRPPEDVRH